MKPEDRPTAQQLQNRTLAAECGSGLICPHCGCGHLENYRTSGLPTGSVRRYRQCRNCQKKWVSSQPPEKIVREVESPKADEDERPVLKVRMA